MDCGKKNDLGTFAIRWESHFALCTILQQHCKTEILGEYNLKVTQTLISTDSSSFSVQCFLLLS